MTRLFCWCGWPTCTGPVNGIHVCIYPGCGTNLQNGTTGMREHIQVVHGRAWVPGLRPPTHQRIP